MILFILQHFPGSVQNKAFCQMFRSTCNELGHEVCWAFRDGKPDGPGLFIDTALIASSGSDVERNKLSALESCFYLRYGGTERIARATVNSLQSQFESILETKLFSSVWAWNSSEPVAAIAKEVAVKNKLKVFSIETGLFLGNYRIDDHDFNHPNNRLPENLSSYELAGRETLEFMRGSGLRMARKSFDGYRFQKTWKKSKRKINVLFLESLITDNGEFPHAGQENQVPIYGGRGLRVLALESAKYKNLNVCVRPHPVLKDRSTSSKESGIAKLYNQGSLEQQLAVADLVVVGASKTAFQAALQGKPVLALGNGFFYGSLVNKIDPGTNLEEYYQNYLDKYSVSLIEKELACVVGYMTHCKWPSDSSENTAISKLGGLGFDEALRNLIEQKPKFDRQEIEILLTESTERILSREAKPQKTIDLIKSRITSKFLKLSRRSV